MASLLNPYIGFPGGKAREAMEDLLMHASLKTPGGFTIMGADNMPGSDGDGTSESAVSISLSGDDESELRGYWDGLVDGATVTVPLEPQMWGDTFGMCTDRYGTGWMVNITPPAA